MDTQNSREANDDISNVIHQAVLNPHISREILCQICNECKQNSFPGLCTNLSHLSVARKSLGNKGKTKLISVIAFPFGFIPTSNKINEAKYAIEEGAEGLDLVPNYFALEEGKIELFAEEINLISELGIPIRVIIDANSLLTSTKLSLAINASIDAGAHGIQIGTGFGPAATSLQTKNISEIVRNRVSIKVVGGIKTFAHARELIETGSNFIGTSFGFEILKEQMKMKK